MSFGRSAHPWIYQHIQDTEHFHNLPNTPHAIWQSVAFSIPSPLVTIDLFVNTVFYSSNVRVVMSSSSEFGSTLLSIVLISGALYALV